MPDLRLFHAPNACSLASAIALAESGLPHHVTSIDLQGDRTDYRRIVPSGRVPALLIDEELLVESPAILLRIAALAPDAALAPTDAAAASQLLSFLCWCASSVHIARRRFKRPHHFTADVAAQAAISRDARGAVEDNLVALDARVARHAWMAGDAFTVADAYALVFFGWALIDAFDLSNLPNLDRWAAAMTARPATRRALDADASPVVAYYGR